MTNIKSELEPKRRERLLRLGRYAASLLLLAVIGGTATLTWFQRQEIRDIRRQLNEARWDVYVLEHPEDDLIQPTVGSIQFLRRGYSITLESANYGQEGLTIAGALGNPTNLSLSNIALNVEAKDPVYSLRDRFLQGKLSILELIDGPRRIGHAQTVVNVLGPGRTAPFRLTIPNVKQTKEQIVLKAWFSGERYGY